MCVLGQSKPVDSVLTFSSGYDTLEYSLVKVTAVSVRLRILFVMLQNTNNALGTMVTEWTSSLSASAKHSSMKSRGRGEGVREAKKGMMSLPAMKTDAI